MKAVFQGEGYFCQRFKVFSLRLSLLPDIRLNQSLNLQSYVRYLVMLHLFLESDESKSSRKIAEYPQDYCVDVVKRFISFNLLI